MLITTVSGQVKIDTTGSSEYQARIISGSIIYPMFMVANYKDRLIMNADSGIWIQGDTVALVRLLSYYFLKQQEENRKQRDVIEAGIRFYNAVPCRQRLNKYLKPYMDLLKKQGYTQSKSYCK